MPTFSDGLMQLLEVLPPVMREKLIASPHLPELVEVVLDYGRPAEARFMHHADRWPQIISSFNIGLANFEMIFWDQGGE
ncbi:MAG: hypothetical protein ACOVSV_10140, partial [Fimbriimonadaceae bacterium]